MVAITKTVEHISRWNQFHFTGIDLATTIFYLSEPEPFDFYLIYRLGVIKTRNQSTTMHFQCIGCSWTESPKSFQDNVSCIHIGWVTVMLQVFLNHFVRYIPCCPGTIPYRPKMLSPISFFQLWEFALKKT